MAKPKFKRVVISVDFSVDLPLSTHDDIIPELMVGGKLDNLNIQTYLKDIGKFEAVKGAAFGGYETKSAKRVI